VLADEMPYVATLDEHTQRFLSALPVGDFSVGWHRIAVYATYGNAETLRVAPSLRFDVRPAKNSADTVFKETICSAAERLISGA
jgi:hypothetical protein